LAKVPCETLSPRVSLELAPTPWNLRGWRVTGQVDAENGRYATLPLRTAKGRVDLCAERVDFREVRAETPDGVSIELDIGIGWAPTEVLIENAMVRGAPDFVEVFIGSTQGKEIYRAIWKDVQWSKTSPPVVKLKSLILRSDPETQDWWLEMDSRLEAENAVCRGLETDRVQLDVRLDLPGSVAVENVTLTRGKTKTEGAVRIRTDGQPSCQFELRDVEGGCDPHEILRAVNPDWDPYLKDLDFDAGSEVACHGVFSLGRDSRFRIEGTVRTPWCSFRGFRFEQVCADWRVSDTGLSWDVPDALFHDGRVNLTGFYDTASKSGLMTATVEQVTLASLLSQLGASADRSVTKGKLSGNCRLQMLGGWSGVPFQLNGNGGLRISEGNLWSVPVFSQLGKLLDLTMLNRLSKGRMSSLGRITLLDADLDFRGERVVVPALRTNGTLISLQGYGEYSWRTEQLNFRVRGEALRKIKLLSFALKPLSRVFNAELTGTPQEHKWRLINVLEQVFSGAELPEAAPAEDEPAEKDSQKGARGK